MWKSFNHFDVNVNKTGRAWAVQHLQIDGCNCKVCQAEEVAEKRNTIRDHQTRVFIETLEALGGLHNQPTTVGEAVEGLFDRIY